MCLLLEHRPTIALADFLAIAVPLRSDGAAAPDACRLVGSRACGVRMGSRAETLWARISLPIAISSGMSIYVKGACYPRRINICKISSLKVVQNEHLQNNGWGGAGLLPCPPRTGLLFQTCALRAASEFRRASRAFRLRPQRKRRKWI